MQLLFLEKIRINIKDKIDKNNILVSKDKITLK